MPIIFRFYFYFFQNQKQSLLRPCCLGFFQSAAFVRCKQKALKRTDTYALKCFLLWRKIKEVIFPTHLLTPETAC